ncbi:MAG TPA: protease pro-enzyme activation domain-containing protein [Acidimicrobiales bacterium]|jgi:hypothetical protein|nr:protease pro-enzyme activation domain-containing protein [Acidimicrobiales bacterium]
MVVVAVVAVVGLWSTLLVPASGRAVAAGLGASVRLAEDALTLPAGTAAAPGAPGRVTVTLTLNRRDQAGFTRYLAAVEDPSSPQYQHFLSDTALTGRFGPSAQSYGATLKWLRSQGLTLVQGSANRLTLTVAGSAAQVDHAFGVTVGNFETRGRSFYATTDAPALPASLAGDVQAISGLSDLGAPSAPVNIGDPPTEDDCNNAAQNVVGPSLSGIYVLQQGPIVASFLEPLAAAYLLPFLYLLGAALYLSALSAGVMAAYCAGYSMGQGVYGFAPSFASYTNHVAGGAIQLVNAVMGRASRKSNGAARPASGANAQKVGLLEYDTFHPSDVQDWLKLLGVDQADATTLAGRVSEVAVNGGVATPGPGESEVLLDVDSVLGASASPAEQVVVYDAPASTSFETMFNAMINDGDTIISNSWSSCEDQVTRAEAQAIDSVLAQAAAGGVSVFNGAGDQGSTCLDGSADTVGVPADAPDATAVGGTSPRYGNGLTYGGETWWNDADQSIPGGQGGFGVSRDFARPAYQNGLTAAAGRSVPDVSLDADPKAGVGICQADHGGCPGSLLYGGTSMAAPEMAALVSDMNQQLGHDIGNANTALYAAAASPEAFHPAASMGSDFAHVGLGSPDYAQLLATLGSYTPGPVSASGSTVTTNAGAPADGSSQASVRVDLVDAHGFPVVGKTVALTISGGHATVSAASGTSDESAGAVTFTVTDTVAETVTVTAEDTSDGVTLAAQPLLVFTAPAADGASISGGPSSVPDDGTSKATVTVYLQNGLGRPAAGKTVTLSGNLGSAVITPAGSSSPAMLTTTDSAGDAVFYVTDTNPDSIDLMATDATDGNLPVPGSVEINFTTGSSSCPTALTTPAAGYADSPFVTGLAYGTANVVYPGNFTIPGCSNQSPPAFDASGRAYVADASDGTIHVFGPGGGTAGPSEELPDASFPGGSLDSLAFGPDGSLYASLTQTNGSVSNPEIVQLDPASGAVLRVVADNASGLPDCPFTLEVDPLSGDLFTDDDCNGFAASTQLSRISNPSSAQPTVSAYVNSGGYEGMGFAPDGTLYVAITGGSTSTVGMIGGTNTSSPAVTSVATVPGSAASVVVASSNSSGQATSLYVFDFGGTVSAVDLTTSPATVTTVGTGATNYFIGVTEAGGCAYAPIPGSIIRFGPAACAGQPATTTGPQLTLSRNGAAQPATGSTVTYTAAVTGVAAPAGTSIRFRVEGTNGQVRLVDAGPAGTATFPETGMYPGTDVVTAMAVIDGSVVSSPPVDVHWLSGRATTFLSTAQDVQEATVGRPLTLTATLADVTTTPAAPVSGASLTLSLAGQQCRAVTDSAGKGSCLIQPETNGLLALAGDYAGSAAYTAAHASGAIDVVGTSTTPPPHPVNGYWLVAADGGVFSYGGATFYGSTGGIALARPVVGMAATPDGRGYWLVASDGGVFAFGDARFYGSTGGTRLVQPIVGMAATPDGRGYWLVAADGGLFGFGDARFYGSTGGTRLHAPIVGLTASSDGAGYWLVASDGGVFAFGDARFLGSTGDLPLDRPMVGIASTPDRLGYWLVASDGGVFAFGDARFLGSTGGQAIAKPVVGLAGTPDGLGYWLDASDGGMFAFGDARFYGSAGGLRLVSPMVAMAASPTITPP